MKLPAAARTCDRLRQWPLFRSPRAYRRQRRGLPRDPGPPVSPTSHRNLRCAPISSALRHFQFSATGLRSNKIHLTRRKPAPKAKFQVSQAPGALRLAGSNRSETSPCGLLDESNLTFQQNSLDIDSIARKPAPEAKFQVSEAPGRAALGRIKQE